MQLVLQNIKNVLKPNGFVLFRDYAIGDLAQERFSSKDQKISENFYVRGDGTRAFYFTEQFLTALFEENGFHTGELGFCCKQVENRSRELVMNRRWIQAVFQFSCENSSDDSPVFDHEVDFSEGMAAEMFGILPSNDEIIKLNVKDMNFKLKVLPKEYQHTCKSTGLMLWESARLMAFVLAENPTIVEGKRVLELGCGCSGICSMVAVRPADLVIATDGDTSALNLLTQNVSSNLKPPLLSKLITKRLVWGNKDHIDSIKELSKSGFDVIIGTDVTYVPEAISPLFGTAKEMISHKRGDKWEPALILCHVLRRVDEQSILSAASRFGFHLVDKWPRDTEKNLYQGIMGSWFSGHDLEKYVPNTALNIMCFHKE